MLKQPNLAWVNAEEDRQKILAAWQTWLRGEGIHQLLAYCALCDEVWLKQYPQDGSLWRNEHQPSDLDDYLRDEVAEVAQEIVLQTVLHQPHRNRCKTYTIRVPLVSQKKEQPSEGV